MIASVQRAHPLSQRLTALPDSPFCRLCAIFPRRGGSLSSKWEPLAVHANFISLPRPLPLGEVDANVVSRWRGRGCFPAALLLPQEAGAADAVRLYDPTREKVNRENPQIFPIGKFKIILPLKMRRAARRAVQIISSSAVPPAHPGA